MLANLNHGGRLAMLGLPSQPIDIDWAKVVTHMITIQGIYGREMFETWYAMSVLLEGGLAQSLEISGSDHGYHRFAAAFEEWDGRPLRQPRRRSGQLTRQAPSHLPIPAHRTEL